MGQRHQRGCFPYFASYVLGLGLFLSLGPFCSSVSAHCKVSLCSRQYANAIESLHIKRGPSYEYCTVLRSYYDCINATSRNCRGELEYHSISSLVLNWMTDFNCTQVIAQGPMKNSTNNYERNHRTRFPPIADECVYRGHTRIYSHCGIFGDPHLKTFLNEFQTCRALGAWPLVDNPYLAVQITNEKVHQGTGATATSKVTVIVRDHSPCTPERTYEAQTDDLPGYFVDGSRGTASVRIKEDDPGRHVEIHIRHISTRIIIRQVGRYLTFAIRMPKEVAMLGSSGESLELCAKGCPKREMIDPNQLLAKPLEEWSTGPYDLDGAVNVCKKHNVTDFYFDACVFDLLTTGDDSFSLAARQAMKDAVSLSPGTHSHPGAENRTVLVVGRKDVGEFVSVDNSAPGRPGATWCGCATDKSFLLRCTLALIAIFYYQSQNRNFLDRF